MLSDPLAEAFGLIHHHPSGENLWYEMLGDSDLDTDASRRGIWALSYLAKWADLLGSELKKEEDSQGRHRSGKGASYSTQGVFFITKLTAILSFLLF